jgi:HSP20 family protein
MLISVIFIVLHPTLANRRSGSSDSDHIDNKALRTRSLRVNPYLHHDGGLENDFFFLQSPFFDAGPAFENHLRGSASLIHPFDTKSSNSFIDSFFSSLLPSPGYEITNLGKNSYQIQMEIPGTKLSDLNIELADNASVLRIAGSRKETRGGGMVSESRFEKRFSVGEVDGSKITAKLEDGLLTLVVPKKEQEKPKEKPNVKIPISTGTDGNGPFSPVGADILELL